MILTIHVEDPEALDQQEHIKIFPPFKKVKEEKKIEKKLISAPCQLMIKHNFHLSPDQCSLVKVLNYVQDIREDR